MQAKRSRRRLKALVSIAFMTALVAGTTATVGAYGGSTSFQSPLSTGWYPTDELTGGFDFDVHDDSYPPRDGDYDERVTDITCSSNVEVTYTPTFPAYGPTTGVIVKISGDSANFSGTLVQCTATYERWDYNDCHFVFNYYCNQSGPWVADGTYVNQRVFKMDGSAPTNLTIHPSSAPNANGWYKTPGTVSWSASDPNSEIRSCTSAAFGGPDGQSKAIFGNCQNNALLQSFSYFVYNYDSTQPNLAPTVTPSSVALNGSATASPDATDPFPGSGIDTALCDPVDTSTVGVHSVSCTATDKAGNSRTASASYTVGYVATGFDAPVDTEALNVANSGQGIPLKWRVTDANGAPITDLASVAVSATSLTCDLDITTDLIEEYSSDDVGLQNLGDGYYQYNWKSPKSYAKSCKTIYVDLGNGVELSAAFRFAK